MLWPIMKKTSPRVQWIVLAGILVLVTSGCGGRGWREYLGVASPSVASVAPPAADQEPAVLRRGERARVHLGRGGQGPHDRQVVHVRPVHPPRGTRGRLQVRPTPGRGTDQRPPGRGLQGGERGPDGADLA